MSKENLFWQDVKDLILLRKFISRLSLGISQQLLEQQKDKSPFA